MPPVQATAQYPNLPPYTAVNLSYVAGYQWRTPLGPGDSRERQRQCLVLHRRRGQPGQFRPLPGDRQRRLPVLPAAGRRLRGEAAPPTITGSSDGMNVTLTWTAPTKNDDDSLYLDGQGFKVYRDDGTGWFLLGTARSSTRTRRATTTPRRPRSRPSPTGTTSARSTPARRRPGRATPPTSTPRRWRAPAAARRTRRRCSGTTGTSDVTLTWTAPTTNTSGSDLTDLAGYRLWRRVGATGSWTMLKGPNPDFSFPVGTRRTPTPG